MRNICSVYANFKQQQVKLVAHPNNGDNYKARVRRTPFRDKHTNVHTCTTLTFKYVHTYVEILQ